ncbi:THAP domain-containing protein 1-like [Haliotis rufescens]|uniref:THAP domain-containing protein 1-like n=1 Tax=Haliotis rufescens TaxID=6454 RepID=UPI00201E827A|nr:THAP domain-containing protein 1-like [Haliotis rufescens]
MSIDELQICNDSALTIVTHAQNRNFRACVLRSAAKTHGSALRFFRHKSTSLQQFYCIISPYQMPASCCAIGCSNRGGGENHHKFFRIPKEEDVRKKWIFAIRRKDWTPTEYSRICNEHFQKGRPSKDPNDADYVPSLFSFKTENAATTKQRINRQNRLKERQENVQRSVAASALLSIASIDDDNSPVSVSVQTDPMMTARSCYPASSQTNIQNREMEDLLSWKEYALHLEMTNRVQEKYISTLEKQAS